jgi:predicted GNAT family acetyltransferase
MAAVSRPTPNGISVSLVYTPPEKRGNGYASACVAALSQRQLDAGKRFCTLFTDLSNSTSNALYQRVGYRPLAEFVEIRFCEE